MCPEHRMPIKIIHLYCRVSEDYDGDGGLRSVDDQEQDGREFLATLGPPCCVMVGKVYKDPNLSGWNPKVKRPDFDACMAEVTSGSAAGLWVYDITRFTRKPPEGEQMIRAAEVGVKLFSNNRERDLRRADDLKWFRDRLAAAEYESKLLSERVTRGKRLKATRRGLSNASTRGLGMRGYERKPAGWRKGDPRKMVPDELVQLERTAARQAARVILGGGKINDAVRLVNAAGVTTYYGNEWVPETLTKMFRRPSLAGYVTYEDEIVEGKDLLPEEEWVLDRDTWHDLQDFFAGRRRGPTARVYLLSGLIRCSKCGYPMAGRPFEGKGQYYCRKTPGRKACGGLRINAAYADDKVTKAVLRVLTDERHHAALADSTARVSAERADIMREMRTAKEAFEVAAEAAGAAGDAVGFANFQKGHLNRMSRLQKRLDDLPVEPRKIGYSAAEARALWDDGDLEERRRMVRDAYPLLTLLPARKKGPAALELARFDWDGDSLPDKKRAVSPARVNSWDEW